jgi:hypothetical protein
MYTFCTSLCVVHLFKQYYITTVLFVSMPVVSMCKPVVAVTSAPVCMLFTPPADGPYCPNVFFKACSEISAVWPTYFNGQSLHFGW